MFNNATESILTTKCTANIQTLSTTCKLIQSFLLPCSMLLTGSLYLFVALVTQQFTLIRVDNCIVTPSSCERASASVRATAVAATSAARHHSP